MNSMLTKAKASWDLADMLFREGVDLDFAANRFYYSLYQIADAFNSSPTGNKLKKFDDQSFHVFMRVVVSKFVPKNKIHLLDAYDELKSLRVQADYFPQNITPSDLEESLLNEASELFSLFEGRLNRQL